VPHCVLHTVPCPSYLVPFSPLFRRRSPPQPLRIHARTPCPKRTPPPHYHPHFPPALLFALLILQHSPQRLANLHDICAALYAPLSTTIKYLKNHASQERRTTLEIALPIMTLVHVFRKHRTLLLKFPCCQRICLHCLLRLTNSKGLRMMMCL
jgi:hypothetical protein